MNWLKQNGYECAELTVDDFRAAVSWGSPHASPRELVRIAQQASRATGVKICGGLYHISDGTFDPGLPQQLDFEMPGTPPPSPASRQPASRSRCVRSAAFLSCRVLAED